MEQTNNKLSYCCLLVESWQMNETKTETFSDCITISMIKNKAFSTECLDYRKLRNS